MSKDDGSITFKCAVSRVKTLADGGRRLELDLPEDTTMAMAACMEYQRNHALLQVTVEVLEVRGKPIRRGRPPKDPGLLDEE